MSATFVRREWVSLALLAVYLLEAGLVKAGWFGSMGAVFIASGGVGLMLTLTIAKADRTIWPTLMVAAQLVCMTCLLLGRSTDTLVLAVWGAAHAPALIAMVPGMLLRARTASPAGPAYRASRPSSSAAASKA
jgi:hypothetical protein